MDRILVLYSTTTGHTARIAGVIAETLRSEGIEPDVADATLSGARPDEYMAVIVAAPVRGGRYPRSLARWVRRNLDGLQRRPAAFISVGLAALDPNPAAQREVNGAIQRFLMGTGWRPSASRSVAGALLYSKYNWLLRWMTQRIAGRIGGDTDTRRDYEYTNWQDLRQFVRTFARTLERAPRPIATRAA